ncbi:GNAT family N-acetyltransferase [Lacinutrix sp. C3R15]|uniref:GNAT family N-acetyltransferase n=1 Tax=Flavobacteriaceae TaxID=49546 RepID=UPI001C08DDB2|nr:MULTISPECIES: GNAT family protein [Flavobacteriaceae]MBU2938132.1 GNAT family N-acetyltransferase [Lacinutrix sp. C3R15]MDO6621446.1 GNAT family protein [Oceanihabitans sp. 1_MG-2023]
MKMQFDDFEINPILNGDAWKICDFIVANQDRLQRYFPKTLKQNLTPTLSQLFVDKKVKQFENKEEFLFTLKQTKTRVLAGIIYIKEIDYKKQQGEFAYCMDYNFEGKGLTSKAVKYLSIYAFETLNLKTLQIIVHKNNIPSVKVAENNSFKWIKTLKNEFTPVGENPLDMELYELYNEK